MMKRRFKHKKMSDETYMGSVMMPTEGGNEEIQVDWYKVEGVALIFMMQTEDNIPGSALSGEAGAKVATLLRRRGKNLPEADNG